jgi:hypothetical protein
MDFPSQMLSRREFLVFEVVGFEEVGFEEFYQCVTERRRRMSGG